MATKPTPFMLAWGDIERWWTSPLRRSDAFFFTFMIVLGTVFAMGVLTTLVYPNWIIAATAVSTNNTLVHSTASNWLLALGITAALFGQIGGLLIGLAIPSRPRIVLQCGRCDEIVDAPCNGHEDRGFTNIYLPVGWVAKGSFGTPLTFYCPDHKDVEWFEEHGLGQDGT